MKSETDMKGLVDCGNHISNRFYITLFIIINKINNSMNNSLQACKYLSMSRVLMQAMEWSSKYC